MDTPPAIAPEADPAVRAFGRLADKVELLEAAIAGLVARRDAAPDYNQTLGEQAARLDKMVEGINILACRPAMQVTPDAMAAEIETAGAKARAADSATIAQARERIDGAARQMERLAGTIARPRAAPPPRVGGGRRPAHRDVAMVVPSGRHSSRHAAALAHAGSDGRAYHWRADAVGGGGATDARRQRAGVERAQ